MAMNSKQQAPPSREEVKAAKKKEEHQEQKSRRIRVRLIPIWLRLILVIILFAASIIVGAAFGYGVMGEGNPMDIFEKSTWTHIRDLIYGP